MFSTTELAWEDILSSRRRSMCARTPASMCCFAAPASISSRMCCRPWFRSRSARRTAFGLPTNLLAIGPAFKCQALACPPLLPSLVCQASEAV
jgi:hypothetical protein